MKKMIFRILLLLAFLGIGIGVWYFVFRAPDDRTLIQARLAELCEILDKNAQEPELTALVKAQALTNFIPGSILVEWPGMPFDRTDFDADQLRASFASWRKYCPEAQFGIENLQVSAAPEATERQVHFDLVVHYNVNQLSQEPEVFTIRSEWVKPERTWLIKQVAIRKVL